MQASAFDADTVALTLAESIASVYFQIPSIEERIGQAQHMADDHGKPAARLLHHRQNLAPGPMFVAGLA